MALAAAGCARAPREKILPYVSQPPEVTPGVPSHYATALLREGYAVGAVVESHEGRPTKIEGNPDHPMSLGGTGIAEQAAILDLYDRDRGAHLTERGSVVAWEVMRSALSFSSDDRGNGLWIVLPPTTSPLTHDLVDRVRGRFPQCTVVHCSPLAPLNTFAGARLAFGDVVETHVDFAAADVVLALDSNFLTEGPAALRSARRFAERRRPRRATDSMSRLWAIEPLPTVTGTAADHRLRVKRSEIARIAQSLLAATLAKTRGDTATAADPFASIPGSQRDFLRVLADDLFVARGRVAVVVGEAQPPIVHAIAHALNELLGAVGNVVSRSASPLVGADDHGSSLAALAEALEGNAVTTLLVLGQNPVYSCAPELDLARNMAKVPRSLYLGSHANETAAACRFYVPLAHALETWGEARAIDGTLTVQQPLRAPLDAARTIDELLFAASAGFEETMSAHDLVRASRKDGWRDELDERWRRSLRRGVVEDSAFPPVTRTVDADRIDRLLHADLPPPEAGLELVLHPDAKVQDGTSTNNAWLLELPDPVTKLTWDNAALLSRATAARLGVADGDLVRIATSAGTLEAPVLVGHGVADDVVALALGWGRRGTESLADGVGVNAYALASAASPWSLHADVTKTGGRRALAIAQETTRLEGRDDAILVHATLDDFRARPDLVKSTNERKRSLYVLPNASARQWGMVVDLAACTGCSACVVACQAENNVPVVGRAGVAKGREMHWLRIDRYYDGDGDDVRALSEPMLCQHCEKAPCEYVCPVNATTHSADGMNQMIYNRCVGTRFCSNNCAWKVRRFNWFDYQIGPDAPDPRVHNPDVTVRERGVMEKCTYCVQRVRRAERDATLAGRPLRDHDVKTACEQACPSAAIVFGDIGDAKTDVSVARTSPRLFAVLGELGTEPHTRYLAKISNPNGRLR